MGKLHSNRRNSAEKLHTVPEYSNMDINRETDGQKNYLKNNPVHRKIILESTPKAGAPELEIISPPGTVPEKVEEPEKPPVTTFRSARPFSSRLSGLSINRVGHFFLASN